MRVTVLVLVLAGCADPSAAWRFEFQDAATGRSARVVEARLLAGGCDTRASVLWRGQVDRATGVTTRPPTLAPGVYGLYGQARDATCAPLAEGCAVVTAPLEARSTVVVTLMDVAGGAPACSIADCRDGRCGIDAGVLDAGADGPPGECIDDTREEDDLPASAPSADLSTGSASIADLVSCGDDEDWSSITLAGGDEVVLEVAFNRAEVELHVDLIAPDGVSVRTASDRTEQGARARGFAATSGTHYVRVRGHAWTANGGRYTLTITRQSGTYYYISPSGDDAAAGSFATPWKTFAHAFSELLAGDTLVVLDGTYERSTTGLARATCGAGSARNGTAAEPIRVVALTERRALVQGDGADSSTPLSIVDCAYWTIEGLYLRNVDGTGTTGSGLFSASGLAAHVTFRRLLAAHPNATDTNPGMSMSGHDQLVEGCEIYDLGERRGFYSTGTAITYRRTYVHGGDASFELLYGGHDELVENCVAADSAMGFFLGGAMDSGRNRLVGTIAAGCGDGIFASILTPTGQNVDNVIRDAVVIDSSSIGVYIRGGSNLQADAITSIRNGLHGFSFDDVGDPNPVSFSLSHALSVENAGSGINVSGVDSWEILDSNSFGHTRNFSTDDPARVMRSTEIDPELGDCLVYIPEASPMKRATAAPADGGALSDIGANIVYRSEDGTVGTVPLWDPVTGEFPCGAVIPGVNDDPATSCLGLSARLHVGGTSSCPIPR